MRPDSAGCPLCQSRFGDSDCIHFSNRGPNDPYFPEFILDDDAGQLAECSPNGFGVFMPTWLSDPPACSLYYSTTQTVPFDTTWPLLFNKEHYDTDSMHDNDKDISRITFNTGGIYLVTLNITWQNITVGRGDVAAQIRKNTGDLIAIDSQPYGTEELYLGQSVSYQGTFAAGEYIEAIARQDGRDADDEPMANRIVVERYSPIFAATFLRLEP